MVRKSTSRSVNTVCCSYYVIVFYHVAEIFVMVNLQCLPGTFLLFVSCTVRTLHSSYSAPFVHCTVSTLHGSYTGPFVHCTVRTLHSSCTGPFSTLHPSYTGPFVHSQSTLSTFNGKTNEFLDRIPRYSIE